ncbi:MAG: hypothetical protein ACKERG_00870 [Candidatus Hodgkinia cicadicola]
MMVNIMKLIRRNSIWNGTRHCFKLVVRPSEWVWDLVVRRSHIPDGAQLWKLCWCRGPTQY